MPIASDWLSVIVAALAFAAMLWRMEYRIGQIIEMANQHFASLSKDHEAAMEHASRRHRQMLEAMEREKDRHHDDHKDILIAMEKVISRLDRIADRMEHRQ